MLDRQTANHESIGARLFSRSQCVHDKLNSTIFNNGGNVRFGRADFRYFCDWDSVIFDKLGCSFGCIQLKEQPSLRSEEHTSELQSRFDLVCRLLLEKKKRNTIL